VVRVELSPTYMEIPIYLRTASTQSFPHSISPIPRFNPLAEPVDEASGIGDLALGFSERLALLRRHDRAEIILVRHHQIKPAPQDARTLFGGPGAPRPKGRVGKLDRAPGFGRSHIGNMPNHGAGRWIIDRDGAAAVGGYPLARDQASVTQ
jgi:hypothetical protein